MTVRRPLKFTGVLSGYQFQAQGSVFRTNLFEQDVCGGLPPGTYRWSRSAHELTFAVADDHCGARVELFTSGAWQGDAAPQSPLDGEWHMPYSCEENVRTFQHNIYLDTTHKSSDRRSRSADLKKYSRSFAWGPSANTATQLTPKALCEGARDREHIMRIEDGYITEDPGTIGLVGSIEFVDDHTFTVSDGHHNIFTVDTFSFRLEGNRLTLTQQRPHDAWQGTWLEEAPWFRAS